MLIVFTIVFIQSLPPYLLAYKIMASLLFLFDNFDLMMQYKLWLEPLQFKTLQWGLSKKGRESLEKALQILGKNIFREEKWRQPKKRNKKLLNSQREKQ